MGALYNSLERQQLEAPRCHSHTRVDVINRLIDWISGKIDYEALILWLSGSAGAGKSAIAHTIAQICERYGWLLATFFFGKTAAERSSIERFVATIAYQMARAIPDMRHFIESAINCDPMIFQQSIETQLTKLVVEPLQQLQLSGFNFADCPFLIIVDGLNECSGNNVQAGIVKSLAAAFHHSPFRIRLLISSRPEVYLQTVFNSSSLQSRLSRLALSDKYSPEEDIYQFLEHSFERILGYEEHFDTTEGLNPTNLSFCKTTLLNMEINPS